MSRVAAPAHGQEPPRLNAFQLHYLNQVIPKYQTGPSFKAYDESLEAAYDWLCNFEAALKDNADAALLAKTPGKATGKKAKLPVRRAPSAQHTPAPVFKATPAVDASTEDVHMAEPPVVAIPADPSGVPAETPVFALSSVVAIPVHSPAAVNSTDPSAAAVLADSPAAAPPAAAPVVAVPADAPVLAVPAQDPVIPAPANPPVVAAPAESPAVAAPTGSRVVPPPSEAAVVPASESPVAAAAPAAAPKPSRPVRSSWLRSALGAEIGAPAGPGAGGARKSQGAALVTAAREREKEREREMATAAVVAPASSSSSSTAAIAALFSPPPAEGEAEDGISRVRKAMEELSARTKGRGVSTVGLGTLNGSLVGRMTMPALASPGKAPVAREVSPPPSPLPVHDVPAAVVASPGDARPPGDGRTTTPPLSPGPVIAAQAASPPQSPPRSPFPTLAAPVTVAVSPAGPLPVPTVPPPPSPPPVAAAPVAVVATPGDARAASVSPPPAPSPVPVLAASTSRFADKVAGKAPRPDEVKSLQMAAEAARKEQELKDRRAAVAKIAEANRLRAAAQKAADEKAEEEEAKRLKMKEIKERKARAADVEKRRKEREVRDKEKRDALTAAKLAEETKKRKMAPTVAAPQAKRVQSSSGPSSVKLPTGKIATKMGMPPSAASSSAKVVPSFNHLPPGPKAGPPPGASQASAAAGPSTIRLVGSSMGPPVRTSDMGKSLGPKVGQTGNRASQAQGAQVLQAQRQALQSQILSKSQGHQSPRGERPGESEAIELADIESEYSDSDDEDRPRSGKDAPAWAQSPEIRSALKQQEAHNPDEIFGRMKPLSMEEVFRARAGKFRARTSSANWTNDGVTPQEEIAYGRRMGWDK